MFNLEEVIPDSQDEGSLLDFEVEVERDVSPPANLPPRVNAMIPSSSSASFVLPRSPLHDTATSTITLTPSISEYTTTINHPEDISTISEFTEKATKPSNVELHSAHLLSGPQVVAKPRPKPRPTGAAKKPPIVTDGTSSSSTSKTRPSSPKRTFSIDIAERIKARRGADSRPSSPSRASSGIPQANAVFPVVRQGSIIISSDDEDILNIGPSKPKQRPTPSSAKRKRAEPDSKLSREKKVLHRASDPEDDTEAFPTKLKKKARTVIEDKDEEDFNPERMTKKTAVHSKEDGVAFDEEPKKKVKKSAQAVDESAVEKPKKKKKKDKRDGSKNSTKNRKGKEESEQFKSREFILDSDDGFGVDNDKSQELAPAIGKGNEKEEKQFKSREYIIDSDDDELSLRDKPVGTEDVSSLSKPNPPIKGIQPNLSRVPVIDLGRLSPLSNLTDEELDVVAKVPPRAKAAPRLIEPIAEASDKTKKEKKKRKSDADEGNKENDPSIGRPSDGQRPAKKAKINKEKSDTGPSNKAVKPSAPSSKSESSNQTSIDASKDTISSTEGATPVKSTKKDARNSTEVEETHSDQQLNENIRPASKSSTTTTNPHLSSKGSLSHPPKNRSLSAILQQVNGSSPRPRGSPAVARSFLTRIAPLHPNRRTPPPPPPRIIPKKTKKELEREEKWEEELQDTVPGWCELEEGERDRLRKQKRDWELGLLED